MTHHFDILIGSRKGFIQQSFSKKVYLFLEAPAEHILFTEKLLSEVESTSSLETSLGRILLSEDERKSIIGFATLLLFT